MWYSDEYSTSSIATPASNYNNNPADDGSVISTSLDSFVLRRMRSSALQKWQSNRTLNTNTNNGNELSLKEQCEIATKMALQDSASSCHQVAAVIFDNCNSDEDEDSDISSCCDDDDEDDSSTILSEEHRDSFFGDWLDADADANVDVAPQKKNDSRPQPASRRSTKQITVDNDDIPALRQVIDMSIPSPPTLTKSKSAGYKPSKSNLRRVKSEERFTAYATSSSSTHHRSNNLKSGKTMRKVVSDADKLRLIPNSKILEDNSDHWCLGGSSSGSSHHRFANKHSSRSKKNRVAGLQSASRSLSPNPKHNDDDGGARRGRMVRAVSDLGRNVSASTTRSTNASSLSSRSPKADRRRMIKKSVSNLAEASKQQQQQQIDSAPRRVVSRPSITDMGLRLKTSKSCHSRLASLDTTTTKKTSRGLSPVTPKSRSCHNRLAVSGGNNSCDNSAASAAPPKKPSRRKSPTTAETSSTKNNATPKARAPSPPPDYRWDHKMNCNKALAA